MLSNDAPIKIGQVTLTVNDLQKVAEYYKSVIGLNQISHDGETVLLGQDTVPLLKLQRDSQAKRMPHEAGLFHTAFLLPERADLARWFKNSHDNGIKIEGAADHSVSEAIYVSDPEGNGIEVYVDRPSATWTMDNGQVTMENSRLDLNELYSSTSNDWTVAPTDTIVGHVHLQVGAITEAEQFLANSLNLDCVRQGPKASFFSSGGYHHHIAVNVWNSEGAGLRSQPTTGISSVGISADAQSYSAITTKSGGTNITDPWGTQFEISEVT
jgi:catechol 2,3-dioxygenase